MNKAIQTIDKWIDISKSTLNYLKEEMQRVLKNQDYLTAGMYAAQMKGYTDVLGTLELIKKEIEEAKE